MYYSQLRAFHAVAQHGGFSNAAAKLNLTQPAISDQVRKLEERFDVTLFDRNRRAVRPTDLGERLFAITRRMFDMEAEAVELLTESRTLNVGHINVSADSPNHSTRLIERFRRQYPGITVSLHICNSEHALQRLVDYDADVAIISHEPEDTRLETRTLSEDDIIAFVRPDDPLAARGWIGMKELSRHPVIMREEGSNTRRTIEAEAHRLGLTINMVMEVNSREAIREAAVSGLGIGVLSRPEFSDDRRLAALDIRDCKRTVPEAMVCLKERAHLRLVKAFWSVADEDAPLEQP